MRRAYFYWKIDLFSVIAHIDVNSIETCAFNRNTHCTPAYTCKPGNSDKLFAARKRWKERKPFFIVFFVCKRITSFIKLVWWFHYIQLDLCDLRWMLSAWTMRKTIWKKNYFSIKQNTIPRCRSSETTDLFLTLSKSRREKNLQPVVFVNAAIDSTFDGDVGLILNANQITNSFDSIRVYR